MSNSYEAVKSAICRRIMIQHVNLFEQYGFEKVEIAINDAASFYGSTQLDEIGTSDVSAYVRSVIESLKSDAGQSCS